MTKTESTIRIAIVGCGAVTELEHLPICSQTAGVRVCALVDPNVARAEHLAKEYGVPRVLADVQGLHELADAAIIAAPHALHASIGTRLLRAGVHALVEKPMALTTSECDQMIDAADQAGVVLAVGLMRRFAAWAQFARTALEKEILGRVRSFEYVEGGVYAWPATSDSFFRKETAGGGVLIDTGAHVLDLVLWLFGDVAQLDYRDDAQGGVEADCEIELQMHSGIRGSVILSRIRSLGSRLTIRCERGDLVLEPTRFGRSHLRVGGQALVGQAGIMDDRGPNEKHRNPMVDSFNSFVRSIQSGQPPLVSGREGRRSIALIERCYRERRPLVYPWLAVQSNSTPVEIAGQSMDATPDLGFRDDHRLTMGACRS